MAATKGRGKGRKIDNADSSGNKDGLSNKDYQRELGRLHGDLVKLQLWAVDKRLKACVVFEGRDGAGKGGAIKAITERVSPRVFRLVALPAPTERKNRRCTSSAISGTCPLQARSSSSIAAGTTAPGSSG